MKAIPLLLILSFLCQSCATSPNGKVVEDAAVGVAGGAAGYVISDGNAAITAGSAIVAVAAKNIIVNEKDKAKAKHDNQLIALGEARATIAMYEALQHTQDTDSKKNTTKHDTETRLVIRVPETKVNGVVIEPTTEYLPIYTK